jgi:hypothetical protein
MATVGKFVDALYAAFEESGIQAEQCQFDDASGQLVIAAETTRVVPVASLFTRYDACSDDAARAALVAAVAEVFVNGAADVPSSHAGCGARLLPQLWPVVKIAARQATLPAGHQLPHCGLHGEEPPLSADSQDLGVVLVCEYMHDSSCSSAALPPIETPVLSSDLARWGISFVDALRGAMEQLRARTKAGPPAEKRWEHHPSGCGQSCWQDRFDAARAALLPKLIATRKRTDGLPEAGGHVVAFATTGCVLATTSKNALGLCFLGDTLHLQIAPDDEKKKASQVLSTTAYRLLKMRSSDSGDGAKQHPLVQKASEGFVWKWLPYVPGGPPLRSPGEFSVPVDQGEVDAILNAAEAGRSIPVFSQKVPADQTARLFAAFKEKANGFFKAGEYLKAISAYDAALALKPPPPDADAAIAHANAAQALLNLANADESGKREGCAAEAMRRALLATQLDPTYTKAHARVAAACDLLGESAAAAEAREKAAACAAAASAAEAKAKAAKHAEAEEKRKVLETKRAADERARIEAAHREELLERERAAEREKCQAEASQDSAAATEKLTAMLGFKDAGLAGLPSGLKMAT